MYIPRHFREDDLAVLQTFMKEHSFATLVTQQDGVPIANHFPFLLETERGPKGTLKAHMARANQQWRTFDDRKEVLVIFQGPHTYVSPSWYEDEIESSVPTWNYSVVHAYGIPRLMADNTELYDLLQTITQVNEAHFENPWILQMPEEYLQKKLREIVGFQIEITRLEGKFKLSQNRSPRDQARVVVALQDTLSPDTAELMRKRQDK